MVLLDAVLSNISSASIVYSVVILAVGLPIAFFLGIAVYNVYFHPLSKFPGPTSRAISEWPYFLGLVRGNSPQTQLELHMTYGDVVRVSPNELTFIRAGAFRDIYGHRTGQPELVKDKKYFSGMGEPTLVHSDKASHAYLRKMLASGFSDSALQRQEAVIQDFLTIFMEKLRVHSESDDNVVDMIEWFTFFSFDVIAYLTYGESFDCLTTSQLHDWVCRFRKLGRPIAFSQAAERLPKILRYPFMALFLSRSLISDVKIVSTVSEEKVNHRLNITSTVPDFMAKFIEAYKDGKMSMFQLNSNAEFIMGAGSETLVTVLSHIVFRLVTNPKIMTRLTIEIRQKFSRSEEITMSGVNQCKYLLACIEETLRVQAPSPQTHPRYTPPEGTTIDGHCVPGGMAVGVPIYAACRSPVNFHNPDRFVPERWLDEDAAYASDIREAAQIFSIGPRDCLGRNLAYVEMKLLIASLVWHFDIEQCFPDCWADQKVFMVWEKPPLPVRLRPARRA